VSLDSIDRRHERIAAAGLDLEVPDWINSGAKERVWSEIVGHMPDEVADHYPPPARDHLNSAVGLVVIATIAGSLAAFVLILWMIGS